MKKVLRSEAQLKLQSMLRTARQEAGFTQESLAAVLGKPQSFVAKYETGERMLNLVELIYILRAMGVDVRAFVGELSDTI